MYKKIIMAACLGIAMLAMQTMHADQDLQAVIVPTITGAVSGCIYGGFIKNNQWLALLVSNILIGRCKDRIFRHFDKASRGSVKSFNAKRLAAMLSLSCETKEDEVKRSTYVINIDDSKDVEPNRYIEMSDLDDWSTLVATLVTLAY
jgi:hypothetical protein